MSKVLKEQHILREDRLLTFDDSRSRQTGIGVQEPLAEIKDKESPIKPKDEDRKHETHTYRSVCSQQMAGKEMLKGIDPV